jgi:putative membrane fusion protein
MSNKSVNSKQRKARLRFRRLIRTVVIIGLILYVIVKLVVSSFISSEKMYSPDYDTLNLNETYSSIIFRKETMISSNSTGPVKYLVNEGDRVKKGLKIASVTHENSDVSSVVEETLDISSYQNMIRLDIEGIETEILATVDKINIQLDEKNFLLVSQLKNDLDILLEKKKSMLSSKKLIDSGDSSFKESYVGGADVKIGAEVNFYSPESGIVTFNSDGLESALTIEQIYNINYEAVINSEVASKSLTSNRIIAGNPVYKIVDNTAWFLVSIIDVDDINLYEKNQKIEVAIDDQKLSGVIADVFPSGSNGALIIKLTEQYSEFYRKRFVDAQIIRDNYQGLKIENTSIIEENGVIGVYVLGLNNKAVFKPVAILGKDDKYSIIKDGYIYIDVDGERVRKKTVDLTDSVIKEGSLYRNGDKIN